MIKAKKEKLPKIVLEKDIIEKKVKEKLPLTVDEMEYYNKLQKNELTNSILRVLGLFALIFVIVCLGFGVVCLSFGTNSFNDKVGKVPEYFKGLFAQAGYTWGQMKGTEYDGLFFFQGTGMAISGVLLWIATILVAVWAIFTLVYAFRDLIKVIKHFFKITGVSITNITNTAKESIDEAAPELKIKKKKKSRKLFDESSPKEEVKERRKEESTVDGYSSEDLDKLLSGETLDKKPTEVAEKVKLETKSEASDEKSLF